MKLFGLLFILLSVATLFDLANDSAAGYVDSKTGFVKTMFIVISFLLGVTLLAIVYFTSVAS